MENMLLADLRLCENLMIIMMGKLTLKIMFILN